MTPTICPGRSSFSLVITGTSELSLGMSIRKEATMLLCQLVKDSSSLHSMVVSRYLKSTPAIFVNVIASAFVKVPMDLLPKRRSSGE